MAFNPILGKDFMILVDNSILAYAESFEYSLDKNEIEVTNLSSGDWDEFRVGTKNWTGSTNALVVRTSDTSRGFDYLLDSYLNDTSIYVAFKPNIASNNYVAGVAYVTSLKVSNPGKKDKVTFSTSFKGTGAITKLQVS